MKRIRTILFLVLMAGIARAQAATVRLAWDAPTTNTDGTVISEPPNYKLYWGTASRNYAWMTNVGNVCTSAPIVLPDPVAIWATTNVTQSYTTNTWTFAGPSATLVSNTYYFAVTCYGSNLGESEWSTEYVHQVVSNLAYRAAWGATGAAATNPLAVVGTGATGSKTTYSRTTLYIRYGIVNGPDFPYQVTVDNRKPGPPTSQRVTP